MATMKQENGMNLTTVVLSQQTIKDLALLVPVHITLVVAFLVLLRTHGL